MLTKRMQVQAIVDRLAGLPVQVQAKEFQPPWSTCWQALEAAPVDQGQEALEKAILGMPERDDVLRTILSARPGYRPIIPSLADIAADLQPIEWVWKGWIPRGLITILGASQGSGKSFVATDLSWRIIHNQGFPDGMPICRPGANIIYVDAELVPQILNERAQNYQMDRSKLFVMLPEGDGMLDLGQMRYQDQLAEMTAILAPELIIIDSLSNIHDGGQNNVEDVRALIGYLIRLAGWAKCGLLLIHHIRKPPGGGQQRMMNFDLGMEDLSGSGYITQQARVVLGLRVVQTGPEFDPDGPRELKVLKNNLGPYQKPLGFKFIPLQSAGVIPKWDTQAPKPYQEPTEMDECKEWLEDFLRAHPEGIRAKNVIEAGKEQGFSRPMIYRSRADLSGHITNTEGRKSPENRWKWSEAELVSEPDWDEG
ncbi:MAG TPA: AAA family ATPase [Anaerolineaceae bacterium]|nr:AAA family ATPase [Anaerolineaceae bacterium]